MPKRRDQNLDGMPGNMAHLKDVNSQAGSGDKKEASSDDCKALGKLFIFSAPSLNLSGATVLASLPKPLVLLLLD
jgi:hypothetical protein